MGRQIPKNVRQIGNVSDSSKIYIEDYVDIFLNQLCEKAETKMRGAFLIGEIVETEENDYIYVNGAIHMKNLLMKGKDIIIEENVWKHACETCKEYFADYEILGWCIAGEDGLQEMNHNIQKMHQKYFVHEKSIFLSKSKREKDEKIFIYKLREMMELKGHYVFYEKNEPMQNYMIACKKSENAAPSEFIDDQAAKTFRSMIQEKLDKQEKKAKFRFAPALVMCLLAALFVGGMEIMRQRGNVTEEVETIVQEEPVMVETAGEILEEDVQPEVVEEEPAIPQETEEVLAEEVEEEIEEEVNLEIYVVKKGDTLASISKERYGDIGVVSQICELNGLENGNLIFVGQKLMLPQ